MQHHSIKQLQSWSLEALRQHCTDHDIPVTGDRRFQQTYIDAIDRWQSHRIVPITPPQIEIGEKEAIQNPIIAAHVASWDTGNYDPDAHHNNPVTRTKIESDMVWILFADGRRATVISIHQYHSFRGQIRDWHAQRRIQDKFLAPSTHHVPTQTTIVVNWHNQQDGTTLCLETGETCRFQIDSHGDPAFLDIPSSHDHLSTVHNNPPPTYTFNECQVHRHNSRWGGDAPDGIETTRQSLAQAKLAALEYWVVASPTYAALSVDGDIRVETPGHTKKPPKPLRSYTVEIGSEQICRVFA
ncbi:MAG: hypothetical protein J7642_21425 [Cyanobacteria bacterium SBC]|nr:hypothetical protein [Cyanobacteria bacterium SBC]